jgi:hypothetical protein
MNRNSLVVSFWLLAGLTAALSAQTSSSNGKSGPKTIQSIRVQVIGCVTGGRDADHYRLTNAVLSGDDVPATAGTVGKVGSGKDISFENSPSFDLIGGDLKALMGQKVEVIGITSDTKLNHSVASNAAIGSSRQDKATLTVSSVKVLAATCSYTHPGLAAAP